MGNEIHRFDSHFGSPNNHYDFQTDERGESAEIGIADPVAKQTIIEILEAASRAPSGTNMRPWKADVAMGAARERLSEAARAAFHADDGGSGIPLLSAATPRRYFR